MWFQKIKKKKLQCFLIGILLFLSTLIFTTSLSMVTSINDYSKNYYNNPNYYDLITYDGNESAKDSVLNWGSNNSKVKDVKTLEAFNTGNNMYHNGTKIKTPDYEIVPLDDYKNVPYGISKIKSLKSGDCPGKEEIWISQLFADTHKISLGDDIEFKINNKSVILKVSSLINDSLQPSTLMNKSLIYINKDDIQHFDMLRKIELYFIKTQKNVDASELGKSLNTAVDIGGYTGPKDMLYQAATMVSSIIGGVSALASILVFIVSIFLIRFIMWNNILKEYKAIGIYKALGFTKREILKFYIIGYSLTAIIGSTLGALCSIPALNFIASKVIKYIGSFNGVNISLKNILITILLFSFIVILNLYLVIRKTNKISPVEALRTGITSSKAKLTKSLIKNNSSSIALSINDIFKYKKTSVYIILSLSISLYLILLFGNMNFTISNMKYHSNTWFGDPNSSVYISLNGITSKEQLNSVLNSINDNAKVKNYTYGSAMAPGAKFDTKKYHIKYSLYGIMTMSSYNDSQGLKAISGRNPKNDNEVAVSEKILKESGLSIGDNIELSVNDKKSDYLISGTYNSFASNGYQIRMLNSEIEKYNPNYLYNEIFVNLKDGYNVKTFENDINGKFSYAGATDTEPNSKDMIETMPGLVNPVTSILITAFAVFSAVIVFNIVIMNIRDNRRNFGIMKALGFTSSEIRNRYLFRIWILTAVSSILAVIINTLLSRKVITIAMGGVDVFINSPLIVAISAAAIFVLITIIVFACSSSIKNTKPTELMEE